MNFNTPKYKESVQRAKKVLKAGDKVRVLPCRCWAKKVNIIFSHWDGQFMVSVTGRSEYHPDYIDRLNGKEINFKKHELIFK